MLKILMLQKQRTALNAKIKALRAQRKQLKADEAELRTKVQAAEEVSPELTRQVDELTGKQTAVDDQIADAQDELDKVEADIAACPNTDENDDDDIAHDVPPIARSSPEAHGISRRSSAPASRNFNCRSRCFSSRSDMEGFYTRSEVKAFLQRVRDMAASGKRAVTGAELNIPTVMLELIRDNLGEYSKLVSKVRLRAVKGKARQNVVGAIPEGVWMEMRGALDQLEFGFTQIETDGYKVGGFIPVDNCDVADSDVSLGEEIMSMLLYAIGLALDKSIVYGLGSGSKMPVGIVTRLAQTAQPGYWGTNQGAWTDLHSSNVLKLNISGNSGAAFYQPLLAALGKASPKYAGTGSTTWLMNHQTHMDLLGRGLNFNAAGALVSGIGGSMPVENGAIVELDFMADNEIVGGYLDLYLLAEREGGSVAQSDHVKFLEDKTVFKATARYDGQPIRGEAFVAVSYDNTEVTTSVSFETHYAGKDMNVLICTAAAHASTAGKTVVTVSGAKAASPTLKYAVTFGGSLCVGDKLPAEGFATLSSGSTPIAAAAGAPITVVELDGNDRVVSLGTVISIPKTA